MFIYFLSNVKDVIIQKYEKKHDILADFLTENVLNLKDEAKINYLKSFKDLTENWIEFFKIFLGHFEQIRRIVECDDDDLLIPKNFFKETVRPLSQILGLNPTNWLNLMGKKQVEKMNSYLGKVFLGNVYILMSALKIFTIS